ncbi:MAG: hypothetical protein JXN64_12150 [Spirochaetes bacterium]|nr:hypothetical protein [Spirochaetota bacterium]
MGKGDVFIKSKNVLIFFMFVTALLLIAHLTVNVIRITTGHSGLFGLGTMFNFFYERNFPTYFSLFLLLFSSCLLSIIFYIKFNNFDKFRFHWGFLALIFLYLSFDEGMEIHEQLSEPVQRMLNILPGSLEYWGWIIPFSILALIFALCYIPFFFHLNKRFRIYFFLSALIYIFGTIGFEFIEGFYSIPFADKHDLNYIINSTPFFILVTIEELLEMGGIIFFVYTLIEYIKSIPFEIQIKFD